MELWSETIVSCPLNSWTMILPSDYARVYVGVTGLGNAVLAYTISTSPSKISGNTPNSPQTITSWPQWELSKDKHGILVWQEWWVHNGALAGFNLQVLERRVYDIAPKRKSASRLWIPGRGTLVDALSNDDTGAKDSIRTRLVALTKRIKRAQP